MMTPSVQKDFYTNGIFQLVTLWQLPVEMTAIGISQTKQKNGSRKYSAPKKYGISKIITVSRSLESLEAKNQSNKSELTNGRSAELPRYLKQKNQSIIKAALTVMKRQIKKIDVIKNTNGKEKLQKENIPGRGSVNLKREKY